MNQEGYRDDTAEKAIRQANRTPYHVKQVLSALRTVAGLSGFEVIGIRDIRTGKEYR